MKAWKNTAYLLAAVMLVSTMACSTAGDDGESESNGNESANEAGNSSEEAQGGVQAAGFPIVQSPIKLKMFSQK